MRVFNIKADGLPNMDDPKLVGRVAFIFDGCVISGWPLKNGNWEANEDVGKHGQFANVKKYIIFDVPVWNLHEDDQYPLIDNDALNFTNWLMENCSLAEDNSLWSYEGEDYTNQALYKIYRAEVEAESKQIQIIKVDRKLGRLAWRSWTVMMICAASIFGWRVAVLILGRPLFIYQQQDQLFLWSMFTIILIAGLVLIFCNTKEMISRYKQITNKQR